MIIEAAAITTRLPPSPSSPTLFPPATGQVKGGFAAFAGSGQSQSCAKAGGGVGFRPLQTREVLFETAGKI